MIKMLPVGFEPTHLSILGLKSNALDHSTKVPYYFGQKCLSLLFEIIFLIQTLFID